MIEVIICTYNGENFIEDQLISILNQSVIPDLISIFDDQSQDRTINIIESVMLKSRVKINVTINKEKKGYRKNFLEAIINSKSKIVFLSDQDDVWVYSKIEIMIANLKKIKVNAVCSNSWVTKKDISEVTTTFFNQKKINTLVFFFFLQFIFFLFSHKSRLSILASSRARSTTFFWSSRL